MILGKSTEVAESGATEGWRDGRMEREKSVLKDIGRSSAGKMGARVSEADYADRHHGQTRLQMCTLVSTNVILGRMDCARVSYQWKGSGGRMNAGAWTIDNRPENVLMGSPRDASVKDNLSSTRVIHI